MELAIALINLVTAVVGLLNEVVVNSKLGRKRRR